jgi:hypothetical protein
MGEVNSFLNNAFKLLFILLTLFILYMIIKKGVGLFGI